MAKIQVFYDYQCPFCKKGYENLIELLPDYKAVEIEWRPIESHPRPENYSPHTDLCIQGFYIAQELGADISAFHALMFEAVCKEKRNVEEPEVLADIIQGIIDREKFLNLLKSQKFASRVNENNDLAYEKEGIWYVPSFRVISPEGRRDLKLDAKGGVGVSIEEMKNFLDIITKIL